MSQPIIQIQHLNKTFGTGPTAVHALEDINLEIEAGEIFGIIGLSGAGKSTLVRCMNLLERPTTGSVLVDGKDLTKLRDKQLRQARQDISMIFQSFNLLMQRTCPGQHAVSPWSSCGTKRADAVKRARELLELVGLGRPGRRLSRPALRRPEAAGGHRPGPGHQPQGPAVRRGHLRPGPHHHRCPSWTLLKELNREAGRHSGGHHPPDECH